MTRFPLLCLSLLMLAAPAWAQEEGEPAPASQSLPVEEGVAQVTPETLELAKKMHEIWPIRTRIESAIDNIAKNFPEEKRAEVKATIRKNVQYDQLQEESIRAMASTYTAEELQAMIDFYGSDLGRSISAKTVDYEVALRPVMTKMMDKAVMDLRTGSARQ
ncbi:MAG: hypothetical protein DI551_00550 [Micavibrio aeruginosavorus]|uniref:DUF2059 domain-containing protein n=1 Tax=Micavibrio aeruginosavorus TaxID=349221 RepID=A0A2W5N5Z1_9BACT|nr:MAG: hypothetical protein DI551_00550 [Micavibrio aeruginosavorus]